MGGDAMNTTTDWLQREAGPLRIKTTRPSVSGEIEGLRAWSTALMSADETRVDEDWGSTGNVGDLPASVGRFPADRASQRAGDEHERVRRDKRSERNLHVCHRRPDAERVGVLRGRGHEDDFRHCANLRRHSDEAVRQDALHDRSGGGSPIFHGGAQVVGADPVHHRGHIARVLARDAAHEDIPHVAEHVLVAVVAAALPHAGTNCNDGQEERRWRLQGEALVRLTIRWPVAEELVDDAPGKDRPFRVGGSRQPDDCGVRRKRANELLGDENGRRGLGRSEGKGMGPASATGDSHDRRLAHGLAPPGGSLNNGNTVFLVPFAGLARRGNV